MPDTEFRVTRAGDVALVTIDNGEDYTKPTFLGEAAMASLDRALTELEAGDFAAAVITGKPFFFVAGARKLLKTTELIFSGAFRRSGTCTSVEHARGGSTSASTEPPAAAAASGQITGGRSK